MHVDLKASALGDRARNGLPLDAIHTTWTAAGRVAGELVPGIWGHVEVVFVTAGLVSDL